METSPPADAGATPPRRLLVISNGHGEDAIGAELVRRLPDAIRVDAYPTLGDGRAYDGVCRIVGPRAQLPSEGWRNVRHSVWRDIAGGGIATVFPGLRFIAEAKYKYDRVVVIGDMMGVYGCWVTGHRNIVYLDVYKTGFGRGYLRLDRMVLRRVAETMFCRSETLATPLRQRRIDARSSGNIMLDTVPRTGLVLPRTRPLSLTLLPGSRAHARDNFALQVAALRKLPAALRLDMFVAVAAAIDPADFAHAAGLRQAGDRLVDGDFAIVVVPGRAMGDALAVSDFVLAQAGTATVQAVGLGRPAITFQTAEDRPSRFRDESAMFGEARRVVAADPAAIAAAIEEWLANPAEIARRGAIGRERVGEPGAMDAIIGALLA